MSPPPGTADGKPLLVTAEMPKDILAWADGLRRAYFPPERNRLRAHVTLFHALPPSSEGEVRRTLAELSKEAEPPPARIDSLMNLGRGTALAVHCPDVVALHSEMQDRFHGLMTPQDSQKLRLHITIQNKVTGDEAKALQAQLGPSLEPVEFRFHGLGLYAYEDGLWRFMHEYPFRG